MPGIRFCVYTSGMRQQKRSRSRQMDDDDEPNRGPKKPQKRRSQKLRIIGGSMRGRVVVYHGAEFTRPMKDSVRESLFNIIGPRIKGAYAIDLFAGTGAVSFEALSRGASRATAIEMNRMALRFLRSTAETLGVTEQIKFLAGDTFRLAGPLLEHSIRADVIDDTPRVIFFCPPYAMWESRAEQLAKLLKNAVENSPPNSLIVAESEKHFDPDGLPPGQWDHRMYGNTRLSFLEPPMVCGM